LVGRPKVGAYKGGVNLSWQNHAMVGVWSKKRITEVKARSIGFLLLRRHQKLYSMGGLGIGGSDGIFPPNPKKKSLPLCPPWLYNPLPFTRVLF